MRKFLLLALACVCALGAFGTASAFALNFVEPNPAQWLISGVAPTVLTSVQTVGELLFENLENGAAILCSGIFVGSVGPKGEDEVTAVLTLGEVPVPELDENPTSGIKCTSLKLCEGEPEIWPVNLPFLTELMLDSEDGLFYDLILTNGTAFPAYAIKCRVFFINVIELCTAAAGFGQVENNGTDVETLGALTPEGNCGSGVENGLIENNAENKALIETLDGLTLAVSE